MQLEAMVLGRKGRYKLLKNIFLLLDRDVRRMPVAFVLILVVAMLDVIGVGLIGTLVAMLLNVNEGRSIALLPGVNKIIHDFLLTPMHLMAIVLSLFCVKGVISVLASREIFRFSENLLIRLRLRLMRAYQESSYLEHLSRGTPSYIRATLGYANQTTRSAELLLTLFSEGFVASALIIYLLTVNWVAVTSLGLIVAVGVFGFNRIFGRRLQETGTMRNRASKAALMAVQEGLIGFKENRVLRAERYFRERLSVASVGLARAQVYAKTVSVLPRYLFEITIVAIFFLIVVTHSQNGSSFSSILPVVAVFAAVAMRIGPSVSVLMTGMSQLHLNSPAITALVDDLRPRSREKNSWSKDPSFPQGSQFRSLALDEVSFSYPDVETKALDSISLELNEGEIIGIIGDSGSGKSTLVDIILGLLAPQSGRVILNGCSDTNGVKGRNLSVAYIPQDILVMDRSLSENVTLTRKTSDTQKPRLKNALQAAQLWDSIQTGSIGLETKLGEDGSRLSGGQKQRVAIARAIYHDREILVFDEATSALDKTTEEAVLNAVQAIRGKYSIIIISHNLSTVQKCDRIYHLKDGKIK
jgi:ATP-binding cassette, subfamily B, bacterial PglK